MGFIRGGLLVTVSVLLFLVLLIGNVFLVVSNSLEYENVKTELVDVAEEMIKGQESVVSLIDDSYPAMVLYCNENSEFVLNVDEIDSVFVFPCEVVGNSSEAVIDYGINNFVDIVYYKEYDCDFMDCFGESEYPFFLVSEKSYDYWNGKFYLSLVISIILMVLILFLVEKKSNMFLITGSLIILSSLIFAKIDWAFSFFNNNYIFSFLNIFLKNSFSVFLKMFILGLIFLVIGIVMKFFGVGFKISKFFEKFQRNKKEISNSKKGAIVVAEDLNK